MRDGSGVSGLSVPAGERPLCPVCAAASSFCTSWRAPSSRSCGGVCVCGGWTRRRRRGRARWRGILTCTHTRARRRRTGARHPRARGAAFVCPQWRGRGCSNGYQLRVMRVVMVSKSVVRSADGNWGFEEPKREEMPPRCEQAVCECTNLPIQPARGIGGFVVSSNNNAGAFHRPLRRAALVRPARIREEGCALRLTCCQRGRGAQFVRRRGG